MLLTIAFFPPIEYFALIAKNFTLSPDKVIPSIVYLEACENYQKQSYRNRCRFYSSNGMEELRVPIVHRNGTFRIPIREIEVDYSTDWVIKAERAIVSAYKQSAYFDYYKDELFAILDSKPVTLWELDLAVINFFLDKTHISAELRFTDEFFPSGKIPEIYGEDFRRYCTPKISNLTLGLQSHYFQIFERKFGFIPNLSIMDLLFNEGPDSIVYLKKLAESII